MRYQLALEIHDRIEEVLRPIKTGQNSTPGFAEAVGVSITPFPHRCSAAGSWPRNKG